MKSKKRILFTACDFPSSIVADELSAFEIFVIIKDGSVPWVPGFQWSYYPKEHEYNSYSDKKILDLNFYQQMIEDPIALLLAERCRKNIFLGPQLLQTEIFEVINWISYTLGFLKPDVMVFHNTPHCLTNYIFFKACQYLNITAIIINFSSFLGRKHVVIYNGHSAKLLRNDNDLSRKDIDIDDYFNSIKVNYLDNIPVLDRMAKERVFGKKMSILPDFTLITSPRYVFISLVRIYLKIRSYRALSEISTNCNLDSPYIVFFLHYQPEESTLPRGGLFVNQQIAIQYLRENIPSFVRILIKEHPSLYVRPWTLAQSVRDPGWYDYVNRLPNTHFVNLDIPTPELINNSMFVASINGLVTLEALARGKRVVNFGSSVFNGISGVEIIDNLICSFDYMKLSEPADLGLVKKDIENILQYTFGDSDLLSGRLLVNDSIETSIALKYILKLLQKNELLLHSDDVNYGIIKF